MKKTAAVAKPRAYRQTVRAEAAAATHRRVVEAFLAFARDRWLDEITLDEVARAAGVTVQTVIRRFGGKDGLLQAVHSRMSGEIMRRREVAPGDVGSAVRALIEDYEVVGDMVMRSLAQEDRHPVMRQMTDIGRRFHRQWVGRVFSPWLEGLEPNEVRDRTDGLVIATDLYVWKLIRRDMARSAADYRRHVESLIAGALAGLPDAKGGKS